MASVCPIVFSQDDEPFELIVVDGGSADRTREIAESYGAQVLQEPAHKGNAPGIGRNYGAKNANGGVFAFLDSDCYPEQMWLTRVAAVLDDRRVGIYGIMLGKQTAPS